MEIKTKRIKRKKEKRKPLFFTVKTLIADSAK